MARRAEQAEVSWAEALRAVVETAEVANLAVVDRGAADLAVVAMLVVVVVACSAVADWAAAKAAETVEKTERAREEGWATTAERNWARVRQAAAGLPSASLAAMAR